MEFEISGNLKDLGWDDCGMFPKMWHCVSVAGNVVHVCEVCHGKWP